LAVVAIAVGQDVRQVQAIRALQPPIIDGVLSEPVWQDGIRESQFTQRDPVENGVPTEKTEVAVAYDDDALYAAVWMYDSAPDSIVARLARRDVWTNSDELVLYLDPYYDRRSGYYFGLNAAGTLYDGTFYNDNWSSDSWDGVWEGAAATNGQGWCAEFRIPYSQLRFHHKEEHIWGINFKRIIRRKNEFDYLVFCPKEGGGFVSRFWDLVGIKDITPSHNFEAMPYLRGKARYESFEEGDPFNDGSEYIPAGGADFKMGIGSNLTLNATVNPDFGQVEVDPAVVNLSDVETFYSEKRPFFIEGSSIYDFGFGGATDHWGFNWSTPDFLYSRRIGGSPRGELPDYDYVDEPEGVHIIGAGKLSGKLPGNWNVGSLHAVTRREHAKIEYDGEESQVEVEPATYYTITRGQKEMNNGNQGLGAIGTATHRFFDDTGLKEDINSNAYSFGIDGWTALDSSKKYVLTGWSGMSHVRAGEERMISLQRSSRHYFQRPDASHVEVDSAASSMTGFAGRLLLNKEKGNWILNTAVGAISPGFDVNDIGFMSRADKINGHFGFGYRWTEMTSWTRYINLLGSVFSNFDFDGNHTWGGIWVSSYFELLNYYSGDISLSVNPRTINNTRTRGGPLTWNRPGWGINTNLYTDSRKNLVFGIGSWGYTYARNDWNHGIWTEIEWKPVANFNVTLSPQIWWNDDWLQWVDYFEDETATHTYGNRYVFAKIYQTELSASARMNWTFTPKLSLQFYAQPLISSGDYSGFKELSRPNSNDYRTYPEEDISYDGETYTIDPDGNGPAESIEFDNPDFSYRSLRGNVILRWEYLPGSTLYLVWTHGRCDDESRGNFDLNRSFDRLFRADSDNIFLVKATYWLSW
jgi:hypothetical protein